MLPTSMRDLQAFPMPASLRSCLAPATSRFSGGSGAIFRMDGRDMVVLADVAAFREDQRLDGGVVDRLDDRLPDTLVGERLLRRPACGSRSSAPCGPRWMVPGNDLRQVDLLDAEFVERIDLAGGESGQLVVGFVVVVVDLVEIDVRRPNI